MVNKDKNNWRNEMKKLRIITIIVLVAMLATMTLTACTPNNADEYALEVNNTSLISVTMQTAVAVYEGGPTAALSTHKNTFNIVTDGMTVAQLVKLFVVETYNITGFDTNADGSFDKLELKFGPWQSTQTLQCPTNSEMWWIIRSSSNTIIQGTDLVTNGSTYYLCYEKVESPAAFNFSTITAPNSSDIYTNYINKTSVTVSQLTVKYTSPDGIDSILFEGKIKYTTDSLLAETLVKAALDKKGIQYSISAGYITHIDSKAYDSETGAYWHSGFMVNDTFMGATTGLNKIQIGEGMHLVLHYFA